MRRLRAWNFKLMTKEHRPRTRAVAGPAIAIFILAFALLSFRLNTLSVWVDEEVSLRIARQPTVADVIEANIGGHRRPPLYQLALYFWMRLVGDSDVAGRWFSVLFGLGSVGLTLLIAHELSNLQPSTRNTQHVTRITFHVSRPTRRPELVEGFNVQTLLPAYLLAISPFFVLYARIIRYYTFVTFLALLSTLFYLKLLQVADEGRWTPDGSRFTFYVLRFTPSTGLRAWFHVSHLTLFIIGYFFSTTALLYADYLAVSLIFVQNLWLLLHWQRYRRIWPSWILGQAGLLIAYLPWVPIQFHQVTRVPLHADLAQSSLGLLLKLAYPIYAFSVGETMFPWELPAIVGVLLCLTLLVTPHLSRFTFYASRFTLHGSHSPVLRSSSFVLLCLLLPILFTAFVLSFLAPDITFLSAASRTAFVAPFFYLLVAGGLARLTTRWRWLALGVLTLVSAYGLANYYAGRHFHNPLFALPTREIVQDVVRDLRDGDIVVSEDDSMFDYYYRRSESAAPHFGDPVQRTEWERAVAQGALRVWVVTMGRDLSRLVHPPGEITGWLEAEGYQLAETHGYVPQDPLYQQLKEWVLGRSAYEYKMLVKRYEKSAKDPLR